MGRRIAIATASAVLALTGCGIDDGELAAPNAQPDRTTAPTNTTEPSAAGGDAEDLLLTADDLGPDWSGTSGSALPSIPLCTETAAVDPADHAQAVFGHSLSAGFLMQTVGVFASEEQARSARSSKPRQRSSDQSRSNQAWVRRSRTSSSTSLASCRFTTW